MSKANGDWIITSKLCVPRARGNLVPRPRLTQKIEASSKIGASSAKLILISAPPGFGKTTLFSERGAQARRPVAWLSLDEGDNDPIRFWSSMIASLQDIHPSGGVHASSLLRTQ